MTSLALLQLVSPALPVGAFSYSEGLEVLIQAGSIADEQAIQAWLEAELQRGAVRLEAAALRPLVEALVGWSTQADAAAKGRLIDLDGWLLATREAAELRAQQRQMGMSLLQLMSDMGHDLPEPVAVSWPAAWAWAAVGMSVPAGGMVEGSLQLGCQSAQCLGAAAAVGSLPSAGAATEAAAADCLPSAAAPGGRSPAALEQRCGCGHGAACPC